MVNARWAHPVFHWYNHLASILIPSIGLEDIIAHTKALTKFTQKLFYDSQQRLSLLDTEVCPVRKSILQNRMALHVVTTRRHLCHDPNEMLCVHNG